MENRKLVTCDQVMDELDRSPLEELREPYSSHLAGCKACSEYRAIGIRLAGIGDREPDIDRWKAFTLYRDNRREKGGFFSLTRVLAGAVAAAVVAVVLTLTLTVKNGGVITADKGNMIASNSTVMTPVSDYNPESSDLNYYREISFQN